MRPESKLLRFKYKKVKPTPRQWSIRKMGFYSSGTAKIQKATKGELSLKLLDSLECKLCPLNHAKLHSPKMLPTGAEEALLYVSGEGGGKIEDEEDEQFVERAPSGNLLRRKIPRELRSRIRYNNTIRCHPPNNRDPEKIEIECCRPSIERDIEMVRPKAIVG